MRYLPLAVLLWGCGGKTNNARHDHEPGARGEDCPTGNIVCDGECTDVSTDPAHCGGCDVACADCRSGVCGGDDGRCPEGMVDCTGECRDLSGDPEYCGGCTDYLCRNGESCWNGVCVCRVELTPCSEGGCVDTFSDPFNCGGCGVTCPGACSRGVCSDDCEAPYENCGGACADLMTSPLHCGSCGTRCAQDQVCLEGDCFDYEPAIGCTTCGGCDCPEDERCCDLVGYGVSCVDTRRQCPQPPAGH